jgi:hypothetical protein
MCSFKLFNQNVCTVNVHEMYYKFNPGPSPEKRLGRVEVVQRGPKVTSIFWQIGGAPTKMARQNGCVRDELGSTSASIEWLY